MTAQTTSGSISGTIVDLQGGSIANATVKTTNTATQAGETVSNDIRTLCIPFVAAKHLHTRSDFTGI
jgi:hypothetical protein